ncbi:hypothetical protein QQ045_007670 [Rhodiola kirilowii]
MSVVYGVKWRSAPQAHDRVLSSIWHAWLPPKVSAFIWRLKKRDVPTDDRVQGCGIPLASKCRCCVVSKQEFMLHLFIQGEVASQVWSLGKRHLDILSLARFRNFGHSFL